MTPAPLIKTIQSINPLQLNETVENCNFQKIKLVVATRKSYKNERLRRVSSNLIRPFRSPFYEKYLYIICNNVRTLFEFLNYEGFMNFIVKL